MLHIYGVPVSVHTRKVIVAAIEKNLPYQLTAVVPVIPGNPPANWRTLSPTGLIPVLSDGDFTLADSTAICVYLERTHPTRPLYPADAKENAQVLWFEQYAGGTVFRNVVHPIFREVFVQPNVNKVPTDAAKVDAVLAGAAPEVFGYLESVAGDGFLVGPRMTMADVAVVSNLITFQYIGFELDASRYPKLKTLFERVIAQPAMRKAIQAEQGFVQSMGLNNQCVRSVLA
ncbi:MAG: glutathione S-transferase family protein [Betaproteobacteria bacterium]